MSSRKVSLLLVPPENGKVKNFTISPYSVYIILGALILFFAVSIFWGVSHFNAEFGRAQLEKLKNENRFLVQRLSEMDDALEEIKAGVLNIVEKDNNIRMVFNIPEVDSETRQLGTGGTFEPDVIPVIGEVAFDLYELQSEIQTLLRTTEFENASYAAVLDEVVSKKYLLDHTPSIKPCEGYHSRGFGMKADPFTGEIQLHAGIDIAGKKGTPVVSAADGVVIYTGWVGRFGKMVIIDHGFGYKTVYGHLTEISVKKGHRVKRWQTVGSMGSTGRSTGPHLHYEIHKNGKPHNPMNYIFTGIKHLF